MVKMTLKKYEGSKADERREKSGKDKEGSKKDNAADRAAVKRINKRK
jgi:hypothetical protein